MENQFGRNMCWLIMKGLPACHSRMMQFLHGAGFSFQRAQRGRGRIAQEPIVMGKESLAVVGGCVCEGVLTSF